MHSLDLQEDRAKYGCQSTTGRLARVLVRAPLPEDAAAWKAFGWRSQPDPVRMAEEHEQFRTLLAEAGAEVIVGTTPQAPNPDAVYVYDPAIVSNSGALLLRPGKEARRIEVDAIEADLAAAGVPVVGRLTAPALAEGGDTLWLDERTLLVGRGYRTNDAGIEALRAALPDVEIVVFDLPHLNGPGEVLHLLSLFSPLDVDLAVAFLPLMPVRLVSLLDERGFGLIEVPEEEFWTMGTNVLALAPRVALALEGNPLTLKKMEGAGVDVRVYRGNEISRKGDGGPTCLTRPLLRE